MVNIIYWKDISEEGDSLHIRRVDYTPRQEFGLHSHDFAEITLITDGAGEHRIGAKRTPLVVGDCLFIPPASQHGLSAGNNGMGLLNFAFPQSVMTELHDAYCTAGGPWDADCAWQGWMSSDDRASISRWGGQLAADPQNILLRDTALRDILRRALRQAGTLTEEADVVAAPTWLIEGLAIIDDPRYYPEALPALCRLTGRSREHINRLIREHYRCSTTAYINRLRMAYAGRSLRSSSRSLLEIQHECGIGTTAHFYTLFKAHFHCTPRSYRMSNKNPI